MIVVSEEGEAEAANDFSGASSGRVEGRPCPHLPSPPAQTTSCGKIMTNQRTLAGMLPSPLLHREGGVVSLL